MQCIIVCEGKHENFVTKLSKIIFCRLYFFFWNWTVIVTVSFLFFVFLFRNALKYTRYEWHPFMWMIWKMGTHTLAKTNVHIIYQQMVHNENFKLSHKSQSHINEKISDIFESKGTANMRCMWVGMY